MRCVYFMHVGRTGEKCIQLYTLFNGLATCLTAKSVFVHTDRECLWNIWHWSADNQRNNYPWQLASWQHRVQRQL